VFFLIALHAGKSAVGNLVRPAGGDRFLVIYVEGIIQRSFAIKAQEAAISRSQTSSHFLPLGLGEDGAAP
jgi:hypothetical protein